jgi:hypothetical protein
MALCSPCSGLSAFLVASPTPYQMCAHASKRLLAAGFTEVRLPSRRRTLHAHQRRAARALDEAVRGELWGLRGKPRVRMPCRDRACIAYVCSGRARPLTRARPSTHALPAQLKEEDSWMEKGTLRKGGRYFFTRAASTLVAFAVGGAFEPGKT